MGLLNFFVETRTEESVPTEMSGVTPATPMEEPRYDVPEEIPEQQTDIVGDVYEKLGITSEAIGKLEQLVAALPTNIPTATKQESIKMTLGVIGLSLSDILLDGTARMEAVTDSIEAYTKENIRIKEETSAEIETLKIAIENAQKHIIETEERTKHAIDVLSIEKARIENLIHFAEGINVLDKKQQEEG